MKKNKIALLLLLPITLSAAACSELDSIEITAVKQAATENERASAIASFFNSPIEIESSVETSYDSYSYTITDQISTTARNTLTVRNEDSRILEREYYVSQNGTAVREYLDISNTVLQEDTEESFRLYYSSPFASMANSDVLNYFTAEETTDGYTYSFNNIGYGNYTQSLITFFDMHDDYTWDDYSSADLIRNFNLYTDADGNPLSWDFYLVRSDRFGGIYEHYTSKLTTIDACDALASYEASDAEHAEILNNAISSLSTDILSSGGNFTEDFSWTVGTTTTNYSNYYDLFYTVNDTSVIYSSDEDALGIMLSNNPLEDSSYGTTYTGLAYGYVSSTDSSYNTTYTYGYYYLGVSPASDYYAFLSSDYYDTLVEVVPQIGNLSGDFFTYDSETGTYEWDLASFTYRSYDSSIATIRALFGVGDYASAYQSNYVWDLDTTEFNFTNLSIKLDANNEIDTMTLDYINYNDVACSTTVSFKDFGTTDLASDPVIAECLEVMGV